MINVEERITYLDSIMAELARAQVQTDIVLKTAGVHIMEMKEDTRRMKQSMEMDTRRMKESMDKETRRMKESMDKETRRVKESMDKESRRVNKVWGDLANKMGTVAEDVVAPNIPRLAVEEFGFEEVEDLMVRVRRASRRGEKRRREWDIICSGPGKVIVVEVKSTPSVDKIREVPDRLAEFFDFFPGYEGRELIGIFASWAIDPALHQTISETGLYGIAMGEHTMEVVARPASRC
jgi:hypothetical protein